MKQINKLIAVVVAKAVILRNMIYNAADQRIDMLYNQIARFKRCGATNYSDNTSFDLLALESALVKITHYGVGRPTLTGALKRYIASHMIVHTHNKILFEIEREVSTQELFREMFGVYNKGRSR